MLLPLGGYQIDVLSRSHLRMRIALTEFPHAGATIDSLTSGRSLAGLHSSPADKLVYYAGHDINIYFVRMLLGLNWLAESYGINQSPPGTLHLLLQP